MKKLFMALTLVMGLNTANAGVGAVILTARNIENNGNMALQMLGSSVAGLSIYKGLEQVWCGNYAIGAFLLVLNENDVISDEGYQTLNNAEVSTKEAFVEIMMSEMPLEEKELEIAALFE